MSAPFERIAASTVDCAAVADPRGTISEIVAGIDTNDEPSGSVADIAAMTPAALAAVLVTAHNEADRIADTVAGLAATFPGVRVVVANDGSTDETAAVAVAAGAEVVSAKRRLGKGGAASLGADHVINRLARDPSAGLEPAQEVVLLCDADLAVTAAKLNPLVEVVAEGKADIAVAILKNREGGGIGAAVGFAHWAIKRRCGFDAQAPISGQRAMTVKTLATVSPFAPRYGMEIGMTVQAVRQGLHIHEIVVDLSHRAGKGKFSGYPHRFKQLLDFIGVFWRTRGGRPPTRAAK